MGEDDPEAHITHEGAMSLRFEAAFALFVGVASGNHQMSLGLAAV